MKYNFGLPLNKLYWIYFLTIGISVFIYGKYRCEFKQNTDILAIEPIPGIDGWIISHFVTFAIAGLLFPDTFYITIILGIAWEFFEMYLGITKPKLLKGITDCAGQSEFKKNSSKKSGVDLKSSSGHNSGYWWYGQKEDVLADLLGFLFGKFFLSRIIN